MKSKNDLSVWYNPYKITSIDHWKWFLKSFKCAWQRMTKGYCYRDIWNLNHYYTRIFIETLGKLKDITISSPIEYYDKETDSIGVWKDKLNEIQNLFKLSLGEPKNPFQTHFDEVMNKHQYFVDLSSWSEEENQIRKNWLEWEDNADQLKHECALKGLEELRKEFFYLYD